MNTPLIQTVAAPTQMVEQPSLLELLHSLWFRRRLLLSTAFLIIAVGIIYMYQIVPLYKASSLLLIGAPTSKVVDIEEVLAIDAAMNTEVEVLRSRELAKKLIGKLNLLTNEEFNPSLSPSTWFSSINPRQWITNLFKKILGSEPEEPFEAPSEEMIERREMAIATDIFLGKLTLNTIKNANVVNVSFESTNPEMAASIANELSEIYIIDQLETKFDATSKATKWLDKQLSEMKEKVEISENAVELYREQHSLTEVKGSKIVGSQLMEVNNQLISARAELAQAKVRLQHVKQLRNESGTDVEASKEVMSSPVIQRLNEQEDSLTSKISEMSINFLPKHKKIQSLNIQLRDVRNKIKLEIDRIVVRLENDVEAAQSKVVSITNSLEEMEQKAITQSKESVRLHSLEREASANKALFETFLGRFKETTSTVGMLEADARVISLAEIPRSASSPKKKLMLIVIIAGAFFTAAVLVFVVQAFAPGVFSPEQIEKELGLPVIGMIPFVPNNKNPYKYVLEKPHSRFAEALNMLKISLMLSSPDEKVKVMQITSSVPKEGKSTLALSFARLLAKSGNKVILVEGDLRRATLETKLGVSAGSKGLTDLVITSEDSIEEFVIEDEESGAYIMPKGGANFVNAADVLSSQRMQEIIDMLKKTFDYVIIDTPPVMAVSDALMIAKHVNKTVFVVQWEKTPSKVIKVAIDRLKSGGVDIAGCVLQQVNLQRTGAYGSGDSGHYYLYGRYGDYYTN